MFDIPDDLETLASRIATTMADGAMPTATLRWDGIRSNYDDLSAGDRRELHGAIAKLTAKAGGGVLIVVLPIGEFEDGPLANALRAVVAGVAGDANLGDDTAEVLEGRVMAFHLGHADVAQEYTSELDLVDAPARELLTPVWQRAVTGAKSQSPADDKSLGSRTDRQLVNLRAAEHDGVRVKPTVAGILAFHADPWQRIAGARIIVDAETESGFHGAMAECIHAASAWAAQHGFPQFAVAELLRNAWVHRDWSADRRASPIRLMLAGRRLDVVSPGSLGEMNGTPNPVLVELCRRAGLMTGIGTGLDDLWADLAEDQKCKLDIGTFGCDVRARLTLLRAPDAMAASMPERALTRSDQNTNIRRQRQNVLCQTPQRRDSPVRVPNPSLQSTGRSFSAAMATNSQTPKPASTISRGAVQPGSAKMPVGFVRSSVAPAGALDPGRPAPNQFRPASAQSAHARDEELLAFTAGHDAVTCRMVQDDLGWTRSTTRDVLARLVANGRLRRTELDPRSPTQSYAIP